MGNMSNDAGRDDLKSGEGTASAADLASGGDEVDLRDLPEELNVDLTGPAVLVVDDEADIRKLARIVLSTSDLPIAVIEEAVNGAEALEALPRLRRQYQSVVVLLDKQLPDLDGLKVAKAMLERDPTELIVLFTAYLTDEVRVEAIDLGITACVTKTRVRTLPAVIATLVGAPDEVTKTVGIHPEA